MITKWSKTYLVLSVVFVALFFLNITRVNLFNAPQVNVTSTIISIIGLFLCLFAAIKFQLESEKKRVSKMKIFIYEEQEYSLVIPKQFIEQQQ